MSLATYLVGDVRARLAELPDASVDLVLTSPPFLALRSYLPAGHPDKALEMGSEATPGEFIDALLDVVEECRRVLAPHGSLCIELGDTYSGSGGAGGDYSDDGLRAEQPKFDGSARRTRASGERTDEESRLGVDARNRARRGGNATVTRLNPAAWPEPKSLCLIPELFRFTLAYGFNPLTGRETERWRVRNVVRWCRPNPPVGRLADKFRPATSEMVVACVDRKRYFDLDAVRTPLARADGGAEWGTGTPPKTTKIGLETRRNTHDGAPPLDWWEISTEPYPGSHYATWPEALCRRPILAMCPQRVCTVCGEPSYRVTVAGALVDQPAALVDERPRDGDKRIQSGYGGHTGKTDGGLTRQTETLGWTDCGHDSWRRGVVLDPFAGSGTTLAVVVGCGRDAIGIDLDARNAELARGRVGMFLQVPGDRPVPANVSAGDAL